MASSAQIAAVEQLVRESVATVDALAPKALRAVLPALQAARDELRKDLQAWLTTVRNGSERFGALQRAQALRALEGALERVEELAPAMGRALRGTRIAAGPLAVANLEHEVQRLGALFGAGMQSVPQIETAAIMAKGDKLLFKRHERSALRYAGAVGDDIKHQFAIGLAKGETFDQLTDRLRKLGNPAARARPIDAGADAYDIATGLFQRHRWWAERMVRTEAMHAYNVLHDESIAHANRHRPEDDEEYLRRWDATGDNRLCARCRALHGKIATIRGTFPGRVKAPPLHPCCRCVVLAWMARWGDMPGEEPITAEPPKVKANRTPKEPPAAPTMREVREVTPEAKGFLDAIGRGDYTAALQHVEGALERRGLVPSVARNTTAVVTDHGTMTKNHSGDAIQAWGYRKWNGEIVISTAADREARAYVKAFGHQRPDDLTAALTEQVDAIRRNRRLMSKKRRARAPNSDSGWARIDEVTKLVGAHAHGVRTVLHEQLHGFSPILPGAYVRAGGQVEEITNEVMTRIVGRDMFGIPANWHTGAYYNDVKAAIDATMDLGAATSSEAFELLGKASERFKRRTVRLSNAAEVVGAFAEDLAHVTGKKPIYTEGVLEKHLRVAATKTAAEAKRP